MFTYIFYVLFIIIIFINNIIFIKIQHIYPKLYHCCDAKSSLYLFVCLFILFYEYAHDTQ